MAESRAAGGVEETERGELAASPFLPLSTTITQHDSDLPREPSERTVSSGVTHLYLLPR